MPRGPRLNSVELPMHVYARGVGRRRIFVNDDDRLRFVRILAPLVIRSKARVRALTLMSNHFHVVISCGTMTVSALMHRALTRYAIYFNRRRHRVGHVFQGRFGSRVVDSDEYLRAVISYVHANPLAAGMVDDVDALARYRWSSFGAVMGSAAPGFVDVAGVLSLHGPDAAAARAAHRRTVAAAAASVNRSDGMAAVSAMFSHRVQVDERIHGTQAFVASPRAVEALLDELDSRSGRQALLRRFGRSAADIVPEICRRYGVDVELLHEGRRRRRESAARAVIAHVLSDGLGERLVDIARATGVSPAAVSVARDAGRALLDDSGWTLAEVIVGWREEADGACPTAHASGPPQQPFRR